MLPVCGLLDVSPLAPSALGLVRGRCLVSLALGGSPSLGLGVFGGRLAQAHGSAPSEFQGHRYQMESWQKGTGTWVRGRAQLSSILGLESAQSPVWQDLSHGSSQPDNKDVHPHTPISSKSSRRFLLSLLFLCEVVQGFSFAFLSGLQEKGGDPCLHDLFL